jgi:hypothetical protein
MEKQKEYNLRYLLVKARTTWGKAPDRRRQRANKRNKNRVGRLPTSERTGKSYCPTRSDVGSERVKLHVTVTNKIYWVLHKNDFFFWQIYVVGNSATFLGVRGECATSLSDFYQIWIWYDIYLTAIGLPPVGSSTGRIYTQTIHRTTQSTQTIHRTTQFTN